MEQPIPDIEIKKAVLSGLHRSHPLPKIIEKILNNLMFLHETQPNQTLFLETARQYILAYLQLGFSYLEHQELFDFILQKAGTPAAEISNLRRLNPPVTANKSQIRSLIGRWPSSPNNSHSITTAIDDIIFHVKNNDYGSYQYYTAKKEGLYTSRYELTITPDCTIFHDVLQNRYYRLLAAK